MIAMIWSTSTEIGFPDGNSMVERISHGERASGNRNHTRRNAWRDARDSIKASRGKDVHEM
jgi:hypothetical protein